MRDAADLQHDVWLKLSVFAKSRATIVIQEPLIVPHFLGLHSLDAFQIDLEFSLPPFNARNPSWNRICLAVAGFENDVVGILGPSNKLVVGNALCTYPHGIKGGMDWWSYAC
jgi:hypothetical protein